MKKNGYGYRQITHYGKSTDPSVQVKLAVYSHGNLTDEEVQKVLDDATDKIILALRDIPILNVRLARVKAIRTKEF